MPAQLDIVNLHAGVEEKRILRGISLSVRQGEVHALMGPNGSGKSTLAYVLLGHPGYRVFDGRVLLDGKDLLAMDTDERARRGLFLGFQYPTDLPGVTMRRFLREAYRSLRPEELDGEEFDARVQQELENLGIEDVFLHRYVNQGFSGGEKKQAEVLQMALFRPPLAVMDETDSGLDIDSLQVVADAMNRLAQEGTGILLITHYQRILRYIVPQEVHVLVDGKIARSGGKELAAELEERGYDWLREEA
ncbi:MAG: Fe-S cluster assembly ATPase SufC [Thermoplasmata archaeon]